MARQTKRLDVSPVGTWFPGFIKRQQTTDELIFKRIKKDKITKQNILGTSLKELAANLPDFRNEFTLLQY